MSLHAILLAIPWSFICIALLLRTPQIRLRALPSFGLVVLYWMKLMGTFGLQFLYTYYYTDRNTSDIFRFFDDGIILSKVASDNAFDYLKIVFGRFDADDGFVEKYFDQMNSWIKPFDSGFYNDNVFIIKVNSLLNFISQGQYEINALIISSLVFAAAILIIKTFVEQPQKRATALVVLSLFPFWLLMLSGVLKESLCVIGFGLTLPLIDSISKRNAFTFGRIISFAIGLYILVSIKPYFIASVAPALIIYCIWSMRNIRITPWLAWITLLIVGFGAAVLLDANPMQYIVQKQTDFLNHSAAINPGSIFHMERLEYTISSVLSSFPNALINSFFRPFPWQINRMGELLMFVENIMMIALVINLLIQQYRRPQKNAIPYLVMAIIPGMILIGLISPVLGATMRYRAPFLLLLIVGLSTYLQNTQRTSSI